MSVDYIVHYCNCAKPLVVLDKESGQEFCMVCGGVIRDEDFEMAKQEDFDNGTH